MAKFGCVRAAFLIAIFHFSALENRHTIVSGCPNTGHDVTRGSPPAGEAGSDCPCGGESVSRYVNRTDVIKEDILRKLRMLKPPNATAQLRHLPDIPLLHSLIEQANNENDNRKRIQNENGDDVDEDHVMAVTILAISQPGPSIFTFTFLFIYLINSQKTLTVV